MTTYNIFTKDIDEEDFDSIIQPIKFPIPFPKYDFHKIPFRQDKLAFLEYFGLRIYQAREIYIRVLSKVDNDIDQITGVNLFLEIEYYVRNQVAKDCDLKSLDVENILPDTEDGNAYMNSLGFKLDFIDDMNRL